MYSLLKDTFATVIVFLFVASLAIFSVPRLCIVICRCMNLKMEFWWKDSDCRILRYSQNEICNVRVT